MLQLETVRLLGHECTQVFERLTKGGWHPPDNDWRWWKTQYARFKLWSADLGVFATGTSSIAFRLRFNSTAAAMVTQLLGSLSDCLQSMSAAVRAHDTPPNDYQKFQDIVVMNLDFLINIAADNDCLRQRPDQESFLAYEPVDRFGRSLVPLYKQFVSEACRSTLASDRRKSKGTSIAVQTNDVRSAAFLQGVDESSLADGADSEELIRRIESTLELRWRMLSYTRAHAIHTVRIRMQIEGETSNATANYSEFPRPPDLVNDTGLCSICCLDLPREEIKGALWRSHVFNDLSPYFCVFKACPSPHVRYPTREALRQHLNTIHVQHDWYCPCCNGHNFEDRDGLLEHLHTQHEDRIAESDLAFVASHARRTRPSVLDECVFCLGFERHLDQTKSEHWEMLVDHMASDHMEQLSLLSLPWSDVEAVSLVPEGPSDDNDKDKAQRLEVYVQGWNTMLLESCLTLERSDLQQSLNCTNMHDLCAALRHLGQGYPDEAPPHSIELLCVSLSQYERLVKLLGKWSPETNVTMLWGLLYLVFKLSFGMPSSVQLIINSIEELCHELRKLHAFAHAMQTGYETLATDAFEICRDLFRLWLNIINMYREDTSRTTTVEQVQHAFKDIRYKIGTTVLRVEKLATIAERRADLEVIRRHLPLQHQDQARLPCFSVPIAQNKKFFGRTEYLDKIDQHLRPGSSELGLRSFGLWALGGMGKTQVALAYAYSKGLHIGQPDQPDAILWIPAFDRIAFLRGVSQIAVDDLRLPSATPGADQENLIIFQTWLNQTSAKWLLIFDNVDDHAILGEFWPACNHGSILVTTRKPSIVTQPLDTGIELRPFSAQQGADMLRSLASRDKSQFEDQAAQDISKLLSGHPLAINQMSAYVKYHNMKFVAFRSLYQKAPEKLRREKKPGSTHVGYDHTLDTVWHLSFDVLDIRATRMLAFLCFLSPSPISPTVFEDCHQILEGGENDFYADEITVIEAKAQLVDTALVGEDTETGHLTLHLLVQEAALSKISLHERQKAFEDAVKLVRHKFYRRSSSPRADLWSGGLPYLSHIDSLASHWQSSQKRKDGLQAPADLCYLLCSASIFIMDNDPFGMRYRLATIAKEAYETLPEDAKSATLWADILIDLQYAVLRLGDFRTALEHARGIDIIQGVVDANDKFATASACNRLGLALDSGGRHVEAEPVLKKAIEILTGDEEEVYRSLWRMHLNYARNRYSVGDFEPAEEHCRLSQEAARKFDFSWDVWAYIHETFASLYLRSGRYDEARKQSDKALAVLERCGAAATTSSLAAICTYRAAQVAIAQGRVKDAIEQALRARTLDRSFKAPITTLARSTRLLYKAYSLDPNCKEQADQAKEEAHLLRKSLPPGRTDMTDDTDEAYERLVDIIQR